MFTFWTNSRQQTQQKKPDKTAMVADSEPKKPFDPWTATKEEADKAFKTLLNQRGLSRVDVSFAREMLDNPEIDILNRWRVAQLFLRLERRAETDQRGKQGQSNWGVSLLIAIIEAVRFKLLLPDWIGKELKRILSHVNKSSRKDYKTSGWNNPNAFGWPYPDNKNNSTEQKRRNIAFWIYRLKHSEKYREKVKGSGIEAFEKIVEILKSEKRVIKLSASSAREIYRKYKPQIEDYLKVEG